MTDPAFPHLCWIPGHTKMKTPCKIVEDLGDNVVTVEIEDGQRFVEYKSRLKPNASTTSPPPQESAPSPHSRMSTNSDSAKTDEWILEDIQVTYKDEMWSIRCGGALQPEYSITEHTIEKAVSELVKQVTRDAIEDEAREWQNDPESHS